MQEESEISFKNVTNELESFLHDAKIKSGFPRALARLSLNETWFSDVLSWLLDPNGSHGFGVKFGQEFLKRLAWRRTNGDEYENNYAHRYKYLKWGKRAVNGTQATGFSLKNSAVFREFYLTNFSRSNSYYSGGFYCDLVYLDLDTDDNFIILIENKLFGKNHPGQLEAYQQITEEKYKRAGVLEYVYLTLNGEPPVLHQDCDTKVCQQAWVRMSWVNDIFNILESLDPNRDSEASDVISFLKWLNLLLRPKNPDNIRHVSEKLFEYMVTAATECLYDELCRLNEGGRGEWKIDRESKGKTRIKHSSKPKTPLYIDVLPNLSISLYSMKDGRQTYDKLLIPFGSNADQIYNLMDIVARDVYMLHFGDSYHLYLGDKRRLTSTERDVRKEYRELFKFVHKYNIELQVLFILIRKIGLNQYNQVA